MGLRVVLDIRSFKLITFDVIGHFNRENKKKKKKYY